MTITRKYHYVYLTTNKINGKQYVGDHSTYNLNDGYLGSGHILRGAIKKYGKQNFDKQILERFMLKKDAYDAQVKYIIQFNTLEPNGYNISPKGGLCVKGCFSEVTLQKMSEKKVDIVGDKHPMFGRKHTEESKKKGGESLKAYYQTEEGIATRKRLSEYRKTHPSPNIGRESPLKGIPRPKDICEKIRKGQIGKVIPEEVKQKNRIAQIERMKNPELRQKQRDASLKQWSDPEWRQNHTGENYRKGNKAA